MNSSLTDTLAIWGAITGTIGVLLGAWGLIWQIRSRGRSPRPNLRVELGMMGDKAYLFGGVVGEAVLIHVTNLGSLPARVAGMGFLMQGNEKQELTFGPLYGMGFPGVNLPADLNPQTSCSILIAYEGVRRAVALSKPLIAWVKTDTGQRFQSPRTQVIRPGTSGYEENLEPVRIPAAPPPSAND